jgi:hypothetical protein
MNSQDSVYDHSKPRGIVADQEDQEEVGIRYDYAGPFASVQERLLSQALNSITMPGEVLQNVVRPNLPQVDPFRARMGYRTRALSILDVMNVNEQFQPERVDFTGSQAGYQGTLRNAQGQGFW